MTDPRQQTNEALHFQPEWCNLILASMGDAVITTALEERVTFFDSVSASLTGRTLEEMDFSGGLAYHTHSLLLIIKGRSVTSVAVSITSTVGE